MYLIPIPLFIDTLLGAISLQAFLRILGASAGFSLVCHPPGLEVIMTSAHLCYLLLPHLLPNFKKFVETPSLLLSPL